MKIHAISRVFAVAASAVLLTVGFSNCKSDTASSGTAVKTVWGSYGGDQTNKRFSSLDQINTTNVKDLSLAWSQSLNIDEAQECTPIIADGMLFVTTAMGPKYVYAYDAKTGAEKWKVAFTIPADFARFACCGLVNRGASYANGKLYVGRLDGKMTCLDAKDGKELWTTVVVDYQQGSVITSPPLIVGNKVVTGHGGGEYGATCAISALDATTGKLLWKTATVPGDDPKVVASWKGDSWKTGGAAPWFIGSYDAELNTIYWGTSNPSPWNATMRGVDDEKYGEKTNLYSCSTLALDPETGKIKWHYQQTPMDAWDYDGVNECILADVMIGTVKTPVLFKADRNGFFYTLDRRTGKLLAAEPFVKTTWAKSVDLATGLPVEDPQFRLTKTNTVKTVSPSLLGGKNWQPMAYNPGTGLVYIPANTISMSFKSAKTEYKRGYFYLGAEWVMAPEGAPAEYIAWDPIAKKKVWGIPQKLPAPGGAATTAGGLVFFGNLEGTFNAVDAKTGASLWTAKTTSGITAAPMTYEVDGKQYVAILEGRPSVIPGFMGGKMAEDIAKTTPAGGKISVYALNGGK